MNEGKITRYSEEEYRITAYTEKKVIKAVPIYPDWTNFVSQRSVRAIAVAPRSHHIWLATWGGVLSWNTGEELTYRRYSSEHGLAGNVVTCICVDRDEYVWAGHGEGGISYFNGQNWYAYDYLQHEPINIVIPAVSSAGVWAVGKDTVYYISGPNHAPMPVAPTGHNAVTEARVLLDTGDTLLLGNAWGLFRLQTGREPEMLAGEPMRTCTALTQDRSGRVWIGTSEGVYYLENDQLIRPITSDDEKSPQYVVALAFGGGRLWVLTEFGLAQLRDTEWHWVSSPLPPSLKLHTITADPHQPYIWIGTDRLLAGMQCREDNDLDWDLDWLPLRTEDELNNIGCCIAERAFNNRVWIGTASGLVAFSSSDKLDIYRDCDNVRVLREGTSLLDSKTSSNLWMLAYPHGIGKWGTLNLPDFRLPQPPGLPVAMAMGQDEQIYVLTGRALWRLIKGEWKACTGTPPLGAYKLVQLPDGQWYLGTSHGVYYLTQEEWRLAGEQPGPLQAGVREMIIVDDQLWTATEDGLWKRLKETWIAYVVEPDEILSDVRTLAPATSSGELWLARERGIVRYNPFTKKQSLYYTPVNSGLASCRVIALAEINDSLWVVTQAGISRMKV